ncbi:MAG: hypothetical protein ACI9BW_003494 [Gammaproteobacteria bacterium]|jgi:hypothetical protein
MEPTDIPLRDIHIPDPISWWPLASGWWALVGLLLLAIVIGIALRIWLQRHRVRRAAVREFVAIEQRYREHRDAHLLARELSQLMRRAALGYGPQHHSAALVGAAWHAHLDTLNATAKLDDSAKATLGKAPYRANESFDSEALLAALRLWVTGLHKPESIAP